MSGLPGKFDGGYSEAFSVTYSSETGKDERDKAAAMDL